MKDKVTKPVECFEIVVILTPDFQIGIIVET